MAFDVRMTAYARHRLTETIGYIQYVCGNAPYAASLLNAIQDALKDLETQEHFRIVDHDISDLVGEAVYRIKIGKYKLVYRVKPKENVILVFLFMHESQSPDNSIFASFEGKN